MVWRAYGSPPSFTAREKVTSRVVGRRHVEHADTAKKTAGADKASLAALARDVDAAEYGGAFAALGREMRCDRKFR